MADSDILSAIETKLTDYEKAGTASPYFAQVFQGDPESVGNFTPLNKVACWWFVSSGAPPVGQKTMGNVMRLDRFRVKCFWLPQVVPAGREATESDIFIVSHDLPADFWGDAQLGGYVSDLDIENIEALTEAFPAGGEINYRTLTFDLAIQVLEGATIAP